MNPGLSAIIISKLQIKYWIWQEQRYPVGFTDSKQGGCDKSTVSTKASFALQRAYFTEGFVIFFVIRHCFVVHSAGIWNIRDLMSNIKQPSPVTRLLFQIWPFQICHAVSACWIWISLADSREFPIASAFKHEIKFLCFLFFLCCIESHLGNILAIFWLCIGWGQIDSQKCLKKLWWIKFFTL